MSEIRDENGLTEAEFLEEYKKHSYPAPYLTADIVIFRMADDGGYEVLLIRRKNHPFIHMRALPGGFVMKGESAEQAAARELKEETGVDAPELEQIGLYSDPARDPRGWIVTDAFFAACGTDTEAQAGDDAADAQWFRVHELQSPENKEVSMLILELDAGEEHILLEAEVLVHKKSGRARVLHMHENMLSTDHGQILCDAWLRMSGR